MKLSVLQITGRYSCTTAGGYALRRRDGQPDDTIVAALTVPTRQAELNSGQELSAMWGSLGFRGLRMGELAGIFDGGCLVLGIN